MLMAVHRSAGINAASDNAQNRGGKVKYRKVNVKRWKAVGRKRVMKEVSNQQQGKAEIMLQKNQPGFVH